MKAKLLISALTMPIMLSGCTRAMELRNEAFIKEIGLDCGEKQVISLRLFDDKKVYSAEGRTLFSALESCETQQSKLLFPGHLEVFAVNPAGMKSSLMTLLSNNRISPSCYVLCIRDSAAKFIKDNDSDLAGLIRSGGRTGTIVPKNISSVMNDLLESDQKAAVPIMNGGKLTMAVVSPDSLTGILTEEESKGLCWLCGTTDEIYIPITADNITTDFHVRKSRVRVISSESGGKAAVTIDIRINGSAENEDIPTEAVKDAVARTVSSLCSRTIAKTVTGMKADLFGIEKSLKAKRIMRGEKWETIIPKLDFYYKIKIAE